jgi:hypothetical protein
MPLACKIASYISYPAYRVSHVYTCAVTYPIVSDYTPCQDKLQHCHVPYSSGRHFPIKVGSDAVTCPMPPDLTSQLRWAPTLPHIL